MAGIIDWDDARIGSQARELAWTVWEFCADKKSFSLDIANANQFLDIYRISGGPVAVEDRSFVIPLIREHLRYEIRRALGAEEQGKVIDRDYLESEIGAFNALRGQSLEWSAKTRNRHALIVPVQS